MACKHMNFMTEVDVARLEDSGRFSASIRINCTDCGHKMRFLGLPLGLDLNGAAISADGTEGRFAIHPVGEAVPNLKDDGPAGFRILNHSPPRS